jgi:flagellar basal body-associated protein FliL
MVKKAKLDILEITIDKTSEEKLQDDTTVEEKENQESSEKQVSANLLSRVKRWARKPLLWIILISVVVLGVVAGISISLYKEIDEGGPGEKARREAAGTTVSVEGLALFEGFVVDQKDEKGNVWIVFCDVALELNEPKTVKDIDSNRVDVRDVIYTLLKKETVKEGLSTEGRIRLKEKLKNDLNHLFGENLVKKIYFTRYEII